MTYTNLDIATKLAQLLLNPITAILKRLLPDITEDALKKDATRDVIVKQADVLLLEEVPAAAFVPRAARHRLIRRVLDGLLDDLLIPEVEAQSAALTGAGETGMSATGAVAADAGVRRTPSDISLGVRSITIQRKSSAVEEDILQAAGDVLPGWKLQPMEDLGGFYIARPPRDGRPTVSEAWDLAYRLSRMPGIEQAEPAISQLPDAPEEWPPVAAGATVGPIAFFSTFGMQDHNVPETRSSSEWSLDIIKAKDIWPKGNHGSGVFIGHVDTGYTRHPEILQNIRVDLGYDTWDDDNDALDDLDPSLWDKIKSKVPVASPGHGTGTASVIASPQSGVCGTAPNARIIPIRATPSVVILPTGSQQEVARGIMKAVRAGAKVISMSLGSPWGSRELELAVIQALDSGVIVCAAAGNVVLAESWLTAVTYPAAYPGVIAVAGCDYHYRPWRDSCRGKEVVVTAPGTDVWRATAERRGAWFWANEVFGTGQGSGTSFAVATVAGIAACWLNYWGGWENLRMQLGGVPRSIPDSFLICLRRHNATPVLIPNPIPPDLQGYPNFDPKDFGVGVINVPALLQINPKEAHDDALASAALVAPVVPRDAAQEVLSEMQRQLGVDTTTLSQVLSVDLGLSSESLPDFLRVHGRELLHYVASSSAIRSRLYQISRAQPPSPVAAAAADAVRSAAVAFPDDSLAAQLTLRGSNALTADLQ